MNRRSTLISLAVVIVAGMGFLYWYLFLNKAPSPYVNGVTAYQILMSDNQSFASAESLVEAGQYSQSIPEYQMALQSVNDLVEQGQVEYKIAIATEYEPNGGYLAAIPLLQSIAANTGYTNITRAYAIQEMGIIYYTYDDPKITTAIFADAPYKSLYDSTNISLSYRRLFEYSASFYPLAIAELRVADWYATQVYLSYISSTSSPAKLPTDTIESYKDSIRADLASAAKDIDRIKTDPNESGNVPYALQREGIVFANMQLSGDDSFGDALTTLQAAINAYSVSGTNSGQDAYARFYYALYLARLEGVSVKQEVQSTLAPLYTDPVYASPSRSIYIYFRSERTDKTLEKNNILLLASYDPNFKKFLVTLGWTTADFTKN